ncbi:MAG: PorP/SprF family type IX secretion system membrane protein [Bacteroidia bacterium]|nr:PorP/SprF family type IX secretion system membrane protein [Bacteroidia bacterium]
MKNRNIILAIFTSLSFGAFAQQLPLYSQYTSLPYLYNPSMVGVSGDVNASLLHRTQWKGIPGAPVTSVFTCEGAIQEKNMGLGLTVLNDNTDISQRVGAYGLYSYHLKINEDQKVLFGLSFGVMNQRIDFSRAIVKDANDPFMTYKTAQRKTYLDATLGATYMWKTLEVGICVPQLIGSKVNYLGTNSSSYYYQSRHYMMSLKYTFDVDKEKGMTVYPLVMLRYAKGAPFQFDVNGVFDWKKRGWAGLCYKHGYAVGVNIGFRVNNSLRAGYAFDYSINSVKNFIGGAHEFFLGYTFGSKNGKSDLTSTGNYDSLINEVTAKNTKQQEEIDKLNEELKKLKEHRDSVRTFIANNPDVKKANVTDFKTEGGSSIKKGMYVVVGAYKSLDNATKDKDFNKEFYKEADLIFNPARGLHYVYVLTSTDIEAANDVLQVIKKKYPDAWIYLLE